MTSPYTVSVSPDEYNFVDTKASPPAVLTIARPSGTITISSKEYAKIPASSESVLGIFGIIKLRVNAYVLVIKKADFAAKILGHTIYRITKVDILPIRHRSYRDHDEETYLELLRAALNAGSTYYSYTWDLTNSFQRLKSLNTNKVFASSWDVEKWKTADDRFFWNKYVSLPLIEAAQAEPDIGRFILPVIMGLVSLNPTSVNSVPCIFGVISRRSRNRAGVRYFSRGIDANGHTSNFNETEQILLFDSSHVSLETQSNAELATSGGQRPTMSEKPSNITVISYVQIRGSIPLYWAEINNLRYKPRLQIGPSSVNATRKDFDEEKRIYGPVYVVNLVDHTGRESPVKKALEAVIKELDDPQIFYQYFDFHNQCRHMRWERVQILIDELRSRGLDQQGWFQASISRSASISDLSEAVVESSQHSVVRTNCMDCLDRTNVVQSTLAAWTLQLQLQAVGIITQGHRWQNVDPQFELVFRKVWTENGNTISKTYSGTDALKTDFTRTGKRTKVGALTDGKNSLLRYIKNNYFDGPRQDAFDLFHGIHLPYEVVESPFDDHRPLFVQAVPYIACVTAIMLISAFILPRSDDNPRKLPMVAFVLFCLIVLSACLYYIVQHGMAYVCWPRLEPLEYASTTQQIMQNQCGNKPKRSSSLIGASDSSGYNAHAHTKSIEEGKDAKRE